MEFHQLNRQLLTPFRAALYSGDLVAAEKALTHVSGLDAVFRCAFALGEHVGAQAYIRGVFAPLLRAIPDLERRDWIVMAGPDMDGADWVGCGGAYVGTFAAPWLDIPPTGHFVHMRFHEYYRIQDGRVVEMQAIWDIPEVMMQAGAWPMAPSLGREGLVPGPASCDGLRVGAREEGDAARDMVLDMLAAMGRHPRDGGPEVMEMERFWHPHMTWYGPAGIGTARGVQGFRNWHQIPFLAAMPDRGAFSGDVTHHFFGDGPYVAVTGWPDMMQTLSHGGWMGIAPTGKIVTMKSLDFWRIEDGRIRENWVLVDLLDLYDQIGVDVLGRVLEFNKARAGFNPDTGRAIR